MRRETQNIVVFLLGFSIASIAVTGAYTRYVKPGLLPWLAVSAAALMVLAFAAMVRDTRNGSATDNGDDGGAYSHRDGMAWLIVIPLIMLICFAPPALNARALTARTTPPPATTLPPFRPLPDVRAPTVPLYEVLMRIAVGYAGLLDNRLISVTGFTMKDAGSTYLAKIVIYCCAADAQLARLRVSGPAAAEVARLPENTWIEVEGTIPAGQHYSGTSSIPVIDVSAVVTIPKPSNAYGP